MHIQPFSSHKLTTNPVVQFGIHTPAPAKPQSKHRLPAIPGVNPHQSRHRLPALVVPGMLRTTTSDPVTETFVVNPNSDRGRIERFLRIQATLQFLNRLLGKLPADKFFTLGRDPSSSIVISDGQTSRRQSILRLRPNNDWAINDNGSSNGTFVNGKRVTSEFYPIKPTDKVSVGETKFRVPDAGKIDRETTRAGIIQADGNLVETLAVDNSETASAFIQAHLGRLSKNKTVDITGKGPWTVKLGDISVDDPNALVSIMQHPNKPHHAMLFPNHDMRKVVIERNEKTEWLAGGQNYEIAPGGRIKIKHPAGNRTLELQF